MEMRDPGPGMPWTPDQFWVCNAAAAISGRRTHRPSRDEAKASGGARVVTERRHYDSLVVINAIR